MIKMQWDWPGFSQQLKDINQNTVRRTRTLFDNTKGEVRRSIRDGSALTGSPGQAVDTGFLRDSWKDSSEGWVWQYSTPARYARLIEEGMASAPDRAPYIDYEGVDRPGSGTRNPSKPAASHAHSRKLTMGAWRKIVDHTLKRMAT
jgi:hypothetical protein